MDQAAIQSWEDTNKVTCKITEDYSDSVAKGSLVSQSANAGNTIHEGDTLKTVFSFGKKPSVEYQNALQKAETYSKTMYMSKQGIYDPLTSEYGDSQKQKHNMPVIIWMVQKESLEISILLAGLKKPKYTKEQVVAWISQFKYVGVNSKEYQKRMIDIFLNAIYVKDDRLIITFNVQGGTHTITLAEIEVALGSDMVSGSPPSSGKAIKSGFS
ncbi:MAG: Ltp family lipoprotein [Clostridiaceae bacterium]|nr:Ltp family lipoprotein [Clostridiaceae bacterium]